MTYISSAAKKLISIFTTLAMLIACAAASPYTATANVNLRSSPSLDASVIVTVKQGSAVEVQEISQDGWARVGYASGEGYIRSEYLSASESFKLTANVNFRKTPSTSGVLIKTIPAGTLVNVTSYDAAGWSSATYDGVNGYIKSEYLAPAGSIQNLSTVVQAEPIAQTPTTSDVHGNYYKATATVNFRADPSLDGAVSGKIPSGTVVEAAASTTEGWHEVTYGGKKGYVKSEYLTATDETPAVEKKQYMVTARVNFRKAPSTDSEVIKTLGLYTKINVLENLADGWSSISVGDQQGYIKTEYITEATNAAVSEKGVELTPWSEAKKIFKLNTPALVYDVGTGLTYTVQSFSNGSHADVEPLTKDDTAIMYKTFGNKWSWDVRAVWVTIGGRTMAASINGQPHGGGVISNNGMNGQICIHFKGSTTHNGNASFTRLHQQKVTEAYNAGK